MAAACSLLAARHHRQPASPLSHPPSSPLQDTWQWSQLPPRRDQPAPVARDFCCMVALEGERLLLHGGLDHSEKRLDDTWIYDAPR